MSDIQKLHRVIDALEVQSSKVSEFNGVLEAVKAAKNEIAASKAAFEVLADEQKKLVAENYDKLSDYSKKLESLESKLRALESKILSVDAFEAGRDRILLKMSELRFASPEQLEESSKLLEQSFIRLMDQQINELTGELAKSNQRISSIRNISVIGFLVLLGGVGFLLKDLFF